MNILHLSDLHRCEYDIHEMLAQNEWLQSLPQVDAVVITGDVFESENFRNPKFNPFMILKNLFGHTPVIFCLGNHEFFFHNVDNVKKYFIDKFQSEIGKYDNVCCLDTMDYYDLPDKAGGKPIRFFGNVLWYDGSMATVPGQDMAKFAGRRWMDMTIKDFNWTLEHAKCREQIERVLAMSDGYIKVLCTHCVPHSKLNWHMVKNQNEINAFSGVADFLDRYKFDYALCGHTHARVTCEINSCKCYNVGSDYQPPWIHNIIEIP